MHLMEHYKWNNVKNEKLKAERVVSFEQVVIQIEHGNVHNIYTIMSLFFCEFIAVV